MPKKSSNTSSKMYEFLHLPEDEKTTKEIQKYVKTLKYKNIVMIGIGGSILGGKMLIESLKNEKTPRVIALDNIDPDFFTEIISKTNLKESIFVIASKSGDTIETIANFIALKNILEKQKISWRKNAIIITENNDNFLNKIAKKEKIKCFHISKDVCGRFSVLGPMGLVPAALAKIDINKILKGAISAKNIFEKTPNTHPASILAEMQFKAYTKQKKPITVIFPYSKKLSSFADWYIQLLSESIGKNKKIGPTPLKAIGVTDQHSQLQLFMDGPDNKFIIFIEIENFENKIKINGESLKNSTLSYLQNVEMGQLLNAEKRAIEETFNKKGRPNITLKLNKLNEENIGSLIYIFELQVALLGEIFNVNAFDQPGVELGKKLTKKYLNAKN
ncbi:MAG: glucose-6-phosphate isomerase, glucose-6-phosphate isomerase [Candidatus Peregrinibacteria bacterium GW2011_GWF2_38_29]|nr:MAG: glucose-6-phosphate isomerase, glucose-6-phosphate isomerase [Candidatus Peregrinibacteria bacterium GW2011_GWF2_38_29]HBB02275.1 glucose-6-phosphate isomerase [Candidatus Peregrinibacteria bacterium]